MRLLTLTLLLFSPLASLCEADSKTLKVYVLVGQSNMQGHAAVSTITHVGMDSKTEALYDAMTDEDGTPVTLDDVWITSIGHDGKEEEKHGKLTAGYGAAGRGPKIGPEFTFGITMRQHVDGPILLIKTAWGGKSLHTDFRSPSAGPYVFNEKQRLQMKTRGMTVNAAMKEREKITGKYYRLMLEHVQRVLKDPARVCPEYDADAGYELAGFVWFQGWNDMVDSGTYPDRGKPGGYDKYSDVLAHFIRDVRKDLNAPKLPFVIGVLGVGGPVEKYGPGQQRYAGTHTNFRNAMAAPAALPEFQGNVVAVRTENFWDDELSRISRIWDEFRSKAREINRDETFTKQERQQRIAAVKAELFTDEELQTWEVGVSNAAFHYLGSAKIIGRIGQGFANALVELESEE